MTEHEQQLQKAAGIEPASGARHDMLDRLSDLAERLVKLIELERSGIRDGDGYWHGSDPLGGVLTEIQEEGTCLQRSRGLIVTT